MTPRSQLDIYLEQLTQTHGFTLEQLAANRAGQIHPTQLARNRSAGRGGGIGCLVFAFILLVGAGGGALALYDDFSRHGSQPVGRVDMNGIYMLAGGGTLLSLLSVAFAFSAFASVKRRRALYDAGKVVVLQGPMQKIHVRRSKGGDSFLYELQGRRFSARREGWLAVTQGMTYRLYTVGEDLLSLEPG